MAQLRLTLLGGISVQLGSGQAVAVPGRKAQALLGYLALQRGLAQPRDKLAALLWSDAPHERARHSLRQTLFAIRHALPPTSLSETDTVSLDASALEVDALEFERLVAAGDPDALERAATLYQGDLLAGLGGQAAAFEEWLLSERERLRELALEALGKLLAHQSKSEAIDQAIQTAVRLLGLDPVQEPVHRALMRLYARQGRRGAALRQYQACVSALRRDLGVEPELETRNLYRELLQHRPESSLSAAAPEDRSPEVPRHIATPATGLPTAGRVPELAQLHQMASETPLVGRDSELARLRDARAQAWQRRVQVVVIVGEAGTGKTRLLGEVVADALADGAQVLLGRAYESESVLPFGLWVDAFRTDALLPEVARQVELRPAWGAELIRLFPELGEPGPPAVHAPGESFRLFEAMAQVVAHLASRAPLLVALEDLHWADEMSVRLLPFVVRRLSGSAALAVVTAREEELAGASVLRQALAELDAGGFTVQLALAGISRADTLALVEALARAGTDAAVLASLGEATWRASEGNPFMIVEAMRALERGGVAESSSSPSLPQRVRETVGRHLERLSDRGRRLAGVASVIGREFEFRLLQHAGGLTAPDAAEGVEELVARRILHSVGERLDFTHDWIRVVAYDRLPPPTRPALHEDIGDALEALHRERLDDVAHQLGHHYSRAGNAQKAIPHLIRFAELAAQRYALDDASRAFQQTMACVEQLPPSERDRCRLDVALRHAFVLSILGRQQEILALLRTHAGHLKRVADPLLTSEYYFRLGLTQFFLGEHAQGQLAAEQALHEGERAGDRERIGKALHVLSLSAFEAGRPRDGIACATRAIPLLDLPHTQHWLALVHHDLAVNCVMAGALDAALDASKREDLIGQAAQWPRCRALAGSVTAWALALRGDDELAVETAQRSLELARDPLAAGLVSGSLGFAYLERGDVQSAVTLARVVDQLRSSHYQSGEARHMALLGEAYLLAGDPVRARETAARALEMSQAAEIVFNIGFAQRALGRIARAQGDLDEAERLLSQALWTFVGCSAVLEAARTRVDLAAVRARKGDGDTAREHLRVAVAAFEAAGAPKRAVEARDLARSLGIALADA